MNRTEIICDFCAHLAKEMILSGANVERIEDTLHRIVKEYQLKDVSLFLLSGNVSISAVGANGECGTRQLTVPGDGIDLDRLRRLNNLSRKICLDPPEPEMLAGLLQTELDASPDTSALAVIAGRLLAMACLCRLFGGTWTDTAVMLVITLAIHWLQSLLSQPAINHILANVICMFTASAMAIFGTILGISKQIPVLMITSSFLMIPGVPMVNAFRNLLCGNELNGILGLFKVTLETLTIVLGLALGIMLFLGDKL